MKNVIVVEVRGGVVQDVHGDVYNQVHIVDWDNLEGGGCALCGDVLVDDRCISCSIDWSEVTCAGDLYKAWGLV